jgi:hypothetical protein
MILAQMQTVRQQQQALHSHPQQATHVGMRLLHHCKGCMPAKAGVGLCKGGCSRCRKGSSGGTQGGTASQEGGPEDGSEEGKEVARSCEGAGQIINTTAITLAPEIMRSLQSCHDPRGYDSDTYLFFFLPIFLPLPPLLTYYDVS